MSSRVCSQCGCSDIDIDSARGDAVCTGCGSVLEDQIIVSEIQFQEGSGGVSSMVGQFVSTDGPKSLSIGGTFRGGMQKESRTMTLQNGKKRIQQLAGQMKLNQMCVDRAFNFFKMAVARRITRGRKTAHVIAACLYLVCRTERTPLNMLLDFSDHLQVNVFVLGKTYMTLAKELCINMPEIDPCLYIPRFAHALEFGEKTHEVSMTAMRLVQRMKRDWMHTGRRPSGLCGAALLVAARIHDFSRTVKNVIKVVKVCQSTLMKRLAEFEETPSSQLTIEEFQTIDLEEEQDPPCFTEGKRKIAKAKMEPSEKHLEEIARLQDEIEDTLQKQKPRGIWAAYAKVGDDSFSIDSDSSRFSDLIDPGASQDSGQTTTSDSNTLENEFKLDTYLHTDSKSDNETLAKLGINDEVNLETKEKIDTRTSNKEEATSREPLSSDSDINLTKDNCAMNKSDTSDKPLDKYSELATELAVGPEGFDSSESLKLPVKQGLAVSPLGLGVEEIVSDMLKEGSDNSNDGQNSEGELDLEGLDDSELDKFILTEQEVAIKTRIWMAENADYLQAQKEKEERLAKEKEEEAKKPPEKKRRPYKKRPRVQYQEGQSAQEAIQKIMQEKRISSKINYDVLNDLTASSLKSPSKTSSEQGLVGGQVRETKIGSQTRLRNSSGMLGIQQQEPLNKKMKLPLLVPESDSGKQDEIVVESGPVQYLQKDEIYDDDEGEEEDSSDTNEIYDDDEGEEEDEEEVTHLSAAQLLGHTGAEEDYYEEME